MPAPGFVENADTVPLIQALTRVADKLPTADSRRDVLTLAGIDPATLGGLRWDAVSFTFAQQLAALFKSYTPNSRQPNYHPLVSLADFLLAFPDNYGLTDADVALFTRLRERGQTLLAAPAAPQDAGAATPQAAPAPPPPSPPSISAEPNVDLDGPKRAQLHRALLDAFPTRPELARMVDSVFSENLAVIAGGDDLAATAFNLIQWAGSRGYMGMLIRGALATNPGNGKLVAFAQSVGVLPP